MITIRYLTDSKKSNWRILKENGVVSEFKNREAAKQFIRNHLYKKSYRKDGLAEYYRQFEILDNDVVVYSKG